MQRNAAWATTKAPSRETACCIMHELGLAGTLNWVQKPPSCSWPLSYALKWRLQGCPPVPCSLSL